MKSIFLAAACLLSVSVFAGNPDDSTRLLQQLRMIDSIESNLHYKTGKVVVADGLATLNIAPGFKFIDGKEAKYIIEDVWGNLKGSETPLGMIVPANSGASYASYAFVVQYNPMGYVKDDDADKINYDDLLKDMKKEAEETNTERRKAGIATMDLVGWAARPHYDKNSKVLYWAKEFKVEGEEENTLNYDIRVLGRKGVLVLTAVSSMTELDSVNANIDAMLKMVAFNEGNRYADFDSNTDEVAAWTIGGLVAGKVLAKVGFFALLLKYIKFIIIGIVALGGTLWRFITGKKKKEEEAPAEAEPAPAEELPAP
jgi:uncharacterized membrane-anchored protein